MRFSLPLPARAPAASRPLLALGHDGLAWLDAEDRLHLPGEPAVEEDARALARRAGLLARSAGHAKGACDLVLGAGFGEQRSLALPALAGADLREVLARKAAQILGCEPSDALFAAFLLRGEAGAAGAAERRWLVRAVRRSHLRTLLLALRAQGLRTARVAWERGAALSGLPALLAEGEPRGAMLVLCVEPHASVASLVHGDELVHQSVIEGDVAAQPSVGAALLQAAKSLDAFWRKESHGQQVERVVLLGADGATERHLSPALHAAFPQVELQALPAADASGADARRAVLRAARAGLAREACLSVGLPPLPSTVLAGALACALALALPALARARMARTREASWREEARALEARVADLPALRAEHAATEELVARLRREGERVSAVGLRGLPLAELLQETLGAFQGRGALLACSYAPGAGLRIEGQTSSYPGESRRALQGIEDRLEQSALLRDVEVRLPSGLPAHGAPASVLDFALTAQGVWP